LDLIKKYGAGSESLSLEQLELLELEPGVNGAESKRKLSANRCRQRLKKSANIRAVKSCPRIWSESNKSSYAHPCLLPRVEFAIGHHG
jgi:hypothetical protein